MRHFDLSLSTLGYSNTARVVFGYISIEATRGRMEFFQAFQEELIDVA